MNLNIKKGLHDIIEYSQLKNKDINPTNCIINPVVHEERKNSNSDNLHSEKDKFSDTQVFLQRIIKDVIKGVFI